MSFDALNRIVSENTSRQMKKYDSSIRNIIQRNTIGEHLLDYSPVVNAVNRFVMHYINERRQLYINTARSKEVIRVGKQFEMYARLLVNIIQTLYTEENEYKSAFTLVRDQGVDFGNTNTFIDIINLDQLMKEIRDY